MWGSLQIRVRWVRIKGRQEGLEAKEVNESQVDLGGPK